MQRTPIIQVGQVYLHTENNEYVVITGVRRTNVYFSGHGFNGMNDVEIFLERCGPVDPVDLEDDEAIELRGLADQHELLIGWVAPEEDEEEEFA
jgi:hypothetical protein